MTATNANIAAAQADYENQKKSVGIAYAFWFFLGVFGAHRFYAGDTGVGVGMLLTLGGLGVWAFVDVFFIGKRIREFNHTTRLEIFARYGLNEVNASSVV